MITVFILLIAFQIKHFLCDYPLQESYMLGKFKPGWDFIKPLAAHCSVHALFTFGIASFFVQPHIAIGLALLDFVLHFISDRLKAGPRWLGRFKNITPEEYKTLQVELKSIDPNVRLAAREKVAANRYFWWALGFDQMWHHVTHYIIIAIIIGCML
jgi:hypothetical protein